jgi:hypothetical protein
MQGNYSRKTGQHYSGTIMVVMTQDCCSQVRLNLFSHSQLQCRGTFFFVMIPYHQEEVKDMFNNSYFKRQQKDMIPLVRIFNPNG